MGNVASFELLSHVHAHITKIDVLFIIFTSNVNQLILILMIFMCLCKGWLNLHWFTPILFYVNMHIMGFTFQVKMTLLITGELQGGTKRQIEQSEICF